MNHAPDVHTAVRSPQMELSWTSSCPWQLCRGPGDPPMAEVETRRGPPSILPEVNSYLLGEGKCPHLGLLCTVWSLHREGRDVTPFFSQPHRLWPARLLCPWNFPGKNTAGCPFLLQGIFSTLGLNLGLLLGRQFLYH